MLSVATSTQRSVASNIKRSVTDENDHFNSSLRKKSDTFDKIDDAGDREEDEVAVFIDETDAAPVSTCDSEDIVYSDEELIPEYKKSFRKKMFITGCLCYPSKSR